MLFEQNYCIIKVANTLRWCFSLSTHANTTMSHMSFESGNNDLPDGEKISIQQVYAPLRKRRTFSPRVFHRILLMILRENQLIPVIVELIEHKNNSDEKELTRFLDERYLIHNESHNRFLFLHIDFQKRECSIEFKSRFFLIKHYS